MTTNYNTNHQIMEMKTEANRLKMAKHHLVQPAFFKECLQQHR